MNFQTRKYFGITASSKKKRNVNTRIQKHVERHVGRVPGVCRKRQWRRGTERAVHCDNNSIRERRLNAVISNASCDLYSGAIKNHKMDTSNKRFDLFTLDQN